MGSSVVVNCLLKVGALISSCKIVCLNLGQKVLQNSLYVRLMNFMVILNWIFSLFAVQVYCEFVGVERGIGSCLIIVYIPWLVSASKRKFQLVFLFLISVNCTL